MRVAVLYSGFIRTWEQCRLNQDINLVADEKDLYFHTYTEPTDTWFKQYIQIPKLCHTEELAKYQGNKNVCTSIANTLQQWHNNYIGFWTTPSDYDVYVRSRCDITLEGSIDFARYDITSNNVFIPVGQDYWGGVNDQFAFGNYHVMKTYFDIYTNYDNLYNSGVQFHPEGYLRQHLINSGINIVRLPFTNTIIR